MQMTDKCEQSEASGGRRRWASRTERRLAAAHGAQLVRDALELAPRLAQRRALLVALAFGLERYLLELPALLRKTRLELLHLRVPHSTSH